MYVCMYVYPTVLNDRPARRAVNTFHVIYISVTAPSNSKPKPYNDADVIAESILDRITDSAEEREDTTIDRYEDEEGKEKDLQLILKTLREIHAHKHHRSRIKPYENYERENDELDAEVDREYGKALIKLYKDLANDKRKQDIHKTRSDIKSKIKNKLKDNFNENTGYLSVGKRNKVDISEIGTQHRSARKKDFHLLPIERNGDANRKRNELFANGNNYQVASVKVDDTVEKEENVITKLDPKEIFLEADSNNTNENNSSKSGPTHSHIKASPPKTKVTSTKHTHHGLDQTTFFGECYQDLFYDLNYCHQIRFLTYSQICEKRIKANLFSGW